MLAIPCRGFAQLRTVPYATGVRPRADRFGVPPPCIRRLPRESCKHAVPCLEFLSCSLLCELVAVPGYAPVFPALRVLPTGKAAAPAVDLRSAWLRTRRISPRQPFTYRT